MSKTPAPFYLAIFRQDIQEAISWSEEKFGVAAADRYGQLIRQALRDVLENPSRPGAQARPDLAPFAYVYHLAFSRSRVEGERVKTPRHIVLYRYKGERVEFARLLHDSRDLSRHVPGPSSGFEAMVQDVKARNANTDPEELQNSIDEVVREVRKRPTQSPSE